MAYNIQCRRATGMPLAKIRRYIELLRETIPQRYQIILKQREKAFEEAKAAKKRGKILEYKVNWYQALMRGEDSSKWRPNMHVIVDKAQAKKKEAEEIKEAG